MEDSLVGGKPLSRVEVKHHPLEDEGDDDEEDDDEGFEVLEQDVKALCEIDHEIEQLKVDEFEGEEDDERTQSEGDGKCQSETKEEDGNSTVCKSQIVEELFQLKSEFSHWTEIRATTIKHLREIADYIDTVSRRLVSGGNSSVKI